MYTVALYTLGCKVSQYETEAIAEAFAERGFKISPFTEACDAYVINTCTVTAESDRKSRQVIRRAIKKNPDAVVAVVGCYSERSSKEIEKISGVDIIIGTDSKLSVVEFVTEKLTRGRGECQTAIFPLSEAGFEKMSVKGTPRTRAYIKIEDGCESRCSYCAIRLARGAVRSKLPEDAISEAEGLASEGILELVLTGIETGAYGRDFDFDYTLGDLISELNSRGKVKRVRLGSLAPELVGASFAERVRGAEILTPHFHISMQSGSNKILASMKRRYNTEMAYENIVRLKEIFPTAEFTTDMMVGFPGESDADFHASLDFIERVGFLDVHVFAYSRRGGTEAASYPDQVPEDVKRERSRVMIDFKNKIRERRLSSIVEAGLSLSVIAETQTKSGEWLSHADNFAEVCFTPLNDKNIQGRLVNVIPVSHKDGVIYGKEI